VVAPPPRPPPLLIIRCGQLIILAGGQVQLFLSA
jgi:hypothetical protein